MVQVIEESKMEHRVQLRPKAASEWLLQQHKSDQVAFCACTTDNTEMLGTTIKLCLLCLI
jgi:hypothetical protein